MVNGLAFFHLLSGWDNFDAVRFIPPKLIREKAKPHNKTARLPMIRIGIRVILLKKDNRFV